MEKRLLVIFGIVLVFVISGCQNNFKLNEIENDTDIFSQTVSEDIESTDVEESLPLSKEKEVLNNGGSVIQYDDYIYYCTSDYDVYAMKEDGTEKNKLIENNYAKKIFAIDRFLIIGGENKILKVSIDTGEAALLAEGSLEYVDVETKEAYFNRYSISEEEKGFYKINIENGVSTKIGSVGYSVLAKEDGIIYLDSPNFGNNDCAVLSTVNSNGELKVLANIPAVALYEEGISYDYEQIEKLAIIDDWIILQVGRYEGPAIFFYGGLVRMNKDGSEIKCFRLEEFDEFYILNDWIYFNYSDSASNDENIYGWYRIHPDLTEKTYMGNEIQNMNAIKDEHIYYNYGKSETASNIFINDLRQCDKDGNDIVTLYNGSNSPVFEDSNYIDYKNIESVGDYIYFTLDVHGYNEADGWQGHSCYMGEYRVRKDGSGLELIYKSDKVWCTK